MAHAELNPETGKIELETVYREKDLVRAVPGSRWEPQKRVWEIPTTWGACKVLRGLFGQTLTVGPNLTEWAIQEVNNRIAPSMRLRDALTLEGVEDAVPEPMLKTIARWRDQDALYE